jgi:hypothetical protein
LENWHVISSCETEDASGYGNSMTVITTLIDQTPLVTPSASEHWAIGGAARS